HYAGAHRIHRCAVRSCDVDPEVKRPRLPGDARVVEVAANRVGSVERLQRPGVHTASIPPTHPGARHVGRGRLPRVVRTRAGGEPSRRVATARTVAAPACYVACLSHNVWGLPRSVTDTRVNPPGNDSRAQERDGPRRGDFSSLLGFGTVARRGRRPPRRRGAISAALAGGALVRSRGSFGAPSPGTCLPTAHLPRSWRRRRHGPTLPGSLPRPRRFRSRPRP